MLFLAVARFCCHVDSLLELELLCLGTSTVAMSSEPLGLTGSGCKQQLCASFLGYDLGLGA